MSKYAKYALHEVVQFVPGDKWAGCIGWISEVKEYDDDTRYMIAMEIPANDGYGGTVYRFSMESAEEFGKLRVARVESEGVHGWWYIIKPPFLPAGEENDE